MAPNTGTEQTFSFEIMAVVIQSLQESGTTLGDKQYALMAAVDGKRSKSAFQHLFRAVKARAKVINDQIAAGEIDVEATPAKSKGGGGSKSTPGSKRKARSETTNKATVSENASVDQDDEEIGKTPTKKAKNVKEEVDDFFK